MLTPDEFKTLYTLIDTYIASDACKSAFRKTDDSDIDYTKMILCVDESVCEGFAYPNPYKITDKVNSLNGKNDFNKTIITIRNRKNEAIAVFKYSDLKN